MTWRERMEAEHGTVYDTDEMGEAFRVVGFSYQMAVAVDAKSLRDIVLGYRPAGFDWVTAVLGVESALPVGGRAALDTALEQARRYFIQALGGLSQAQGFAQIGVHWDGTGGYGPYYNIWASRERDGLILGKERLSESQLFDLLDGFTGEEVPTEPVCDDEYPADDSGWFDVRAALEQARDEGAGLRDAWKEAAKRWRRSYQALAQRVDSHWDRWPDIVAGLKAEGAAEERERLMKVTCRYCREEIPVVRARSGWCGWLHRRETDEGVITMPCWAGAIRNAEEADDD